MVKLVNELKQPIKVRDTYTRGSQPDYSEWVEEKRKPVFSCFSDENYNQIAINYLPRRPGIITCPNCLNSTKPKSKRRLVPATHYTALCLSPVLLFWVPYLLPCFQGKIHYCSFCNTNLGISGIRDSSKRIRTVGWYTLNEDNADCERDKGN